MASASVTNPNLVWWCRPWAWLSRRRLVSKLDSSEPRPPVERRRAALVRRRPYALPSAAAELGFAGAVVVIGVVFAVVSATVAVFVDVIKVLAAAFMSGSSGSSNPTPSSSAR